MKKDSKSETMEFNHAMQFITPKETEKTTPGLLKHRVNWEEQCLIKISNLKRQNVVEMFITKNNHKQRQNQVRYN